MTPNHPFLDRPPLGVIIERDLDALLLLEIHVSQAFRQFLVGKATQSHEERFLGAWRGVHTHRGESDLLMLSDVAGQGRTALLIENKINARAQPTQAARYRERGQDGVRDGHWQSYVVCLCSPARYLPDDPNRDWDLLLTFEEVEGHLSMAALADPRASFLQRAIKQGITKHDAGSFRPDAIASDFWMRYQQLCREEFPGLGMTPLRPEQSRNEPWPRFAAGVLPSNIRLEHKPRGGCVDMTFSGRQTEDIKARLASLLGTSVSIARTPPSCALRRTVSVVSPLQPFEPQRISIVQALEAAQATLDLWPQVRSLL